jgi:hypothetical protein
MSDDRLNQRPPQLEQSRYGTRDAPHKPFPNGDVRHGLRVGAARRASPQQPPQLPRRPRCRRENASLLLLTRPLARAMTRDRTPRRAPWPVEGVTTLSQVTATFHRCTESASQADGIVLLTTSRDNFTSESVIDADGSVRSAGVLGYPGAGRRRRTGRHRPARP